jgi:hypothetical protein
MFMAAAVWSSCSKNEIESPVIDDTNEIKVSSSLVDVNASTRAPYEGAISSTNTLTAWVLATETTNNYSALYAAGTMTFKDANSTAYDKPTLYGDRSLPDGVFYLSGLYPVDGWGINSTTITDGTLTHALTGTEDVLYAEQVATSNSAVIEGNFPTLVFAHKLTYLNLSVYGDDNSTGSGQTKIKSITLEKALDNNGDLAGVPTTITVDLNTPKVEFTGSGNLSFYRKTDDAAYTFTDAAASYTVTNSPAAQAYVLAPPVVATAGKAEYQLKVEYYYNAELRSPVLVDINLKNSSTDLTGTTASLKIEITLQFTNSGEIKAKATVTDWTPYTVTEEGGIQV